MSKKTALFLVVLFLVTATIFGENLRILVSPFTNNSAEEYGWVGYGMEASVVNDLSHVKQVEVIGSRDRKRAIEEISYQMSGLVAEEMISKAGRQLGAGFILSGEYTVIGEEIRLTSRLSSVESGAVVSSIKLNGFMDQIFALQDRIVIELLAGIDPARSGGVQPIKLSSDAKRAISQEDQGLTAFQYKAQQLELTADVPQEFLDIEAEIFEAINVERDKVGAPPLKLSPKLSALSRYHSMNMQVYNFFDFVDQNGMNSMGRRLMLSPELFGPSREVIAVASHSSPEKVAQTMMEQWMSSETGEILKDPSFNYAGVGIYRGDGDDLRYYCSLIPATLMVELVSDIQKNVPYGKELELIFRFIGNYDKDDVGIVVRYPDNRARYRFGRNSYTEGYGIYKPVSWDGDFFTIELTCDKGKGAYVIQSAQGDDFYPFGVTFLSR